MIDSDTIYQIFKFGSPEEKKRLIQLSPENSFKSQARSLIATEEVGMVIVAVTGMITEYCHGSNPDYGCELAKATHALAHEAYQRPGHSNLLPTTLSGLAFHYLNAANLLGRSEEVIRFADEYAPFYASLNEMENLPGIYCAKAAALLNLNQIDAAESLLNGIDTTLSMGAGIEKDRLLKLIAQKKGGQDHIPPANKHPDQTGTDINKAELKKIIEALDKAKNMLTKKDRQ